jgi:hypothetical protein
MSIKKDVIRGKGTQIEYIRDTKGGGETTLKI